VFKFALDIQLNYLSSGIELNLVSEFTNIVFVYWKEVVSK
jgi:hypothetical protein